jgi:NADPH:quinone reductase-like Zn-dependent oxidoreductase
MKAILHESYGSPDVLQLKDVEIPVPDDDQLLIKVHASSINTSDLSNIGNMARIWGGLNKPKDPRLGTDVAGQVEVVGKNVTRFRAGDEVFGTCAGAYAEYAVAREKNIVLKPANVTFEEAAAVPVAGITALQGLRDKGRVQPGQKVVINGASGGVGTFAVQIAKSFGAEVTAVCSARNLDQARLLGADHVIDYTREDFTRNGQRYDLILAVNGYHPIAAYRRSLSAKGIYLMVGASKKYLFSAMLEAVLLGPSFSRTGGKKMGFMGIAEINQNDLLSIKDLIEAGKVIPAIDRCYPLSETADAFRYIAEGHARAKVIISVRSHHPVEQ